ncbi:MAG: hypothetical protein WC314_23780, partial [Vulcanimicrobiota bacterium]
MKKLADEGIHDLDQGRGTEISSIEEVSVQAIADLRANPEQTGSKLRPELGLDIRACGHLAFRAKRRTFFSSWSGIFCGIVDLFEENFASGGG